MAWSEASAPHQLLEDGFAPDPCDLLVIGCGSILRGDDAVGPVLIRTLFTRGVPEGVRLVDGGTAGMDVAFGMRGASRVVIVDASNTGAAPGTVYRVPAEELTELPPIDGLHTHNFRWDHALSFSAWLLGPLRPTDVTVFLVEAAQFEPGSELSQPVAAGMNVVIELIEGEFYPQVASQVGSANASGEDGTDETVEINEAGYLHIPAALAARYFPGDACLARVEDEALIVVPLVSAEYGGLVLKQRNTTGDRSVLVSEVLGFRGISGRFTVAWDDARALMCVQLVREGGPDGVRSSDRGDVRLRAVDGLPGDRDDGGGRPQAGTDLLHRAESAVSGRRDREDGGSATAAERLVTSQQRSQPKSEVGI